MCTYLTCDSTLTTHIHSLNVLVTFLQLCEDVFSEGAVWDRLLRRLCCPGSASRSQNQSTWRHSRILIGCLTVWKSSSYSRAAKEHITVNSLLRDVWWIWCYDYVNLPFYLRETPTETQYRVQTTFPLGERLQKYCNAVANLISLYCKGTYILTYLQSWALPEKLPIVLPLRNFPAF
jgi:hypothetical protein